MPRTALYRHFDASDCLLYVGVSDCLSKRDRQHAATSEWHDLVCRTEAEWCETRKIALEMEKEAIRVERPRFNRAMSASYFRSGNCNAEMLAKIATIWPVKADIARAINVGQTTVRAWFARGSIPNKYDAKLIDAAKREGHDLTPDDLFQLRQSLSQGNEGAAA